MITLWYRPPELLLGATKYGPEIDLWSVGCILAELLTAKPLLPGKNEAEQVELIFRLCGTPTEEAWPGAKDLQWFSSFPSCRGGADGRPQRRRLAEVLAKLPDDARDLCDKLLTLDPARRLTAKAALQHDYFFNDPRKAKPEELGVFEESHEFQTKKRRQEARAQQDAQQGRRPPGGPQPGAPPVAPIDAAMAMVASGARAAAAAAAAAGRPAALGPPPGFPHPLPYAPPPHPLYAPPLPPHAPPPLPAPPRMPPPAGLAAAVPGMHLPPPRAPLPPSSVAPLAHPLPPAPPAGQRPPDTSAVLAAAREAAARAARGLAPTAAGRR